MIHKRKLSTFMTLIRNCHDENSRFSMLRRRTHRIHLVEVEAELKVNIKLLNRMLH